MMQNAQFIGRAIDADGMMAMGLWTDLTKLPYAHGDVQRIVPNLYREERGQTSANDSKNLDDVKI